VTLRGGGGEGKTALAIECVRRLEASRRFQRAAFVNVETYDSPHTVLTELGRQLVPDYLEQSANQDARGILLIERELKMKPTLIVLDNMESAPPGVNLLDKRLIEAGQTRVIFTTREPLAEPFSGNEIPIGRLDRESAIELVARALAESHWMLPSQDNSDSEDAIREFVDAVNCHARALVLLAPLASGRFRRICRERKTEKGDSSARTGLS
jgi:hypothetical protein